MRELQQIKNIVIKIGSSSLCDDTNSINKEKILQLIQQIVTLKRKGMRVTLVSSGAIAAGMHIMNLKERPTTIPKKQALAAIGQASLMQIYEELFSLFDIKCAQVLLNHDDFDDRKRLMNVTNALQAIIEYDTIAIINENDTVAVDEIKFGDNDTLGAMVVPLIDADLFVIVSDIDGLYDDNPNTNHNAKLIYNIEGVTSEIESYASDSVSKVGTGGMITKLKAAKMVNDYGCDMAIINGNTHNILIDLLDGKMVGTYFYAKKDQTLSSRKHWIQYRSLPKGKIIVDDGAKEAIVCSHRSLLPSGIIDVQGNFMMSQVVDIVDLDDKVIAKGIVNYSSDEIRFIKQKNSSEIEAILLYKDYDEVIHANNMVVC